MNIPTASGIETEVRQMDMYVAKIKNAPVKVMTFVLLKRTKKGHCSEQTQTTVTQSNALEITRLLANR
jgi:hypothetical protein